MSVPARSIGVETMQIYGLFGYKKKRVMDFVWLEYSYVRVSIKDGLSLFCLNR